MAINLANVTGMDGDRILLPGGGGFMISRSNVAEFKAALQRFCILMHTISEGKFRGKNRQSPLPLF